MYKKILVPLEGTENDKVILVHVRHLAKNVGAAVVLLQLHRVIKDDDPFMKSVQVEVGSAGYLKKEKAETYLAELEHAFIQDGIEVSKEFIVAEEAEADAIVKYAEEKECDLIALANQQSKGVGRWFFLNIEEKVKRRSSLPVLLVAGPIDKEKS
jgi:nucleotide-binding universal stress UspA family protein